MSNTHPTFRAAMYLSETAPGGTLVLLNLEEGTLSWHGALLSDDAVESIKGIMTIDADTVEAGGSVRGAFGVVTFLS